MNASFLYIAASIVILAVLAILVVSLSRNKKINTLTPLAGLAFGFILAGIFFGSYRFIGYSLLGVGVILAVIDIFNRARSR
jgi:positive regulator of sigma E activity